MDIDAETVAAIIIIGLIVLVIWAVVSKPSEKDRQRHIRDKEHEIEMEALERQRQAERRQPRPRPAEGTTVDAKWD